MGGIIPPVGLHPRDTTLLAELGVIAWAEAGKADCELSRLCKRVG